MGMGVSKTIKMLVFPKSIRNTSTTPEEVLMKIMCRLITAESSTALSSNHQATLDKTGSYT
jgi:hypothetical protein